MVSGWALAVAGLAWLIVLAAAWRNRHLCTRWLAFPPALLAFGALIVIVIGVVIPAEFEYSRVELDAVASQALSHPPGWSENYGFDGPRQVGSLEVSSVTHRDDGVVVVGDADSGLFFQMSGWAYSPPGPPKFNPGVRGKPPRRAMVFVPIRAVTAYRPAKFRGPPHNAGKIRQIHLHVAHSGNGGCPVVPHGCTAEGQILPGTKMSRLSEVDVRFI